MIITEYHKHGQDNSFASGPQSHQRKGQAMLSVHMVALGAAKFNNSEVTISTRLRSK